jgi:hypothetical protein
MSAAPSVVIDDFNFGGPLPGPHKAHPELIVDADAVLAAPITKQRSAVASM